MIQSLPSSLIDIANEIGVQKTFALVEAIGGQRLWIPRNPPLDWLLFKILGHEAGGKLSRLCGGNQIEIPVCQASKLAVRNQQIRKDRELLTVGQLTAKYGLRRSQIRKICNVKNAL
jgi:hypothetical protein